MELVAGISAVGLGKEGSETTRWYKGGTLMVPPTCFRRVFSTTCTWLMPATGTNTPPGPAIQSAESLNAFRAVLTVFTEHDARCAISASGIVQNPLATSTASIMTRATANVEGVVMRRPTSVRCNSRCAAVQNPDLRQACSWLAGCPPRDRRGAFRSGWRRQIERAFDKASFCDHRCFGLLPFCRDNSASATNWLHTRLPSSSGVAWVFLANSAAVNFAIKASRPSSTSPFELRTIRLS